MGGPLGGDSDKEDHMQFRKIAVITMAASLSGAIALSSSAMAAPASTKHANVAIKGKGAKTLYTPDTLNLTQIKGKTCTIAHYLFSVTNRTGVSQTVTDDGNPFSAIAPKAKEYFCQGVGTVTYSLESNLGATLTVTVSPRPKG
jgi:hypothetical protein